MAQLEAEIEVAKDTIKRLQRQVDYDAVLVETLNAKIVEKEQLIREQKVISSGLLQKQILEFEELKK